MLCCRRQIISQIISFVGSDSHRPLTLDEDDELLQYAIQQSLMEAGSEEDQVILLMPFSFSTYVICNPVVSTATRLDIFLRGGGSEKCQF